MLNLEIDGRKSVLAASIYDNNKSVGERGRRKLIEYGNNLVKQGEIFRKRWLE